MGVVIGFCCSCGGGEECVREGKAVDTTGVTVQREGERQKKKGFDTQILNQNTQAWRGVTGAGDGSTGALWFAVCILENLPTLTYLNLPT